MHAIILAAGRGKRLTFPNFQKPKCLLSFRGQTLIQRLIVSLNSVGFTSIDIVTGYKSHVLIEHINTFQPLLSAEINFISNKKFSSSGNFYSLSLALKVLNSESAWVFDSDCIFEQSLFGYLSNDQTSTSLIVTTHLTQNQDKVFVSSHGLRVIGVSKNLNGIPSRNIILSEYIGVLKLSQKSIRILSNLSSVDNDKDYEEVINDEIANLDFEVLNLQSLSWHEIDTEKDYYSILENWKY